MTDEEKMTKDLLVVMYQESMTASRHYETQRATITSSVFTIDAIVIGLITYDKSIIPSDGPLAIFLLIIAFYGLILSLKHSERFSLHWRRSSILREKLDQLYTKGSVESTLEKADQITYKRFPLLRNIDYHMLWISLHCLVALVGVYLIITAYFFPIRG
jgi:hypothetical protein